MLALPIRRQQLKFLKDREPWQVLQCELLAVIVPEHEVAEVGLHQPRAVLRLDVVHQRENALAF